MVLDEGAPAAHEVRLHVDDSGGGTPLVLTHGLGDDADTWAPVTERLRRAHRVVTWDLRGHRRSAAPAGDDAYSRDVAVADLRRVVDATGPPVTLVGHSLGGYLSLVLALRQPELVTALVMISAGPGYRSARGRAEWNAYLDRVVQEMPIAPPVAGLARQSDGWVMEHLADLRPPLLQVVGERDTRFHAGVAHVAGVVPGSAVVTVPGAGHHPQRTHPDEVAAAVAAHVAAAHGGA